MRIILLAVAAVVAVGVASPVGASDIHVRGHTRPNGTYVQPHYRTNPDNSLFNNYSTQGNINPYMGRAGTVAPYRAPPAPSLNTPGYGSTPYGTYRRW